MHLLKQTLQLNSLALCIHRHSTLGWRQVYRMFLVTKLVLQGLQLTLLSLQATLQLVQLLAAGLQLCLHWFSRQCQQERW